MKRLTTDNPVYNVDVMLNYAYAKDGRVFLRYGDGDIDIDLCEYISRMAAGYQCKPTPEEVIEGECMECDCPLGILYVVATQAAELRARLKEFEDREENEGKQSEGEWNEDIIGFCNVCMSCGVIVERTAIKNRSGQLNFCPNCSAKMKGGNK